MLSDLETEMLFSQPAVNGKQTWWLAAVHPALPQHDRACVCCGALDTSHPSMDLQTIWDSMEENLLQRNDALSATMRNLLHSCDLLHEPDIAADVAVCKICKNWITHRNNKKTTPLHALIYLIRTAQSLPHIRSADLRVLHKLCCALVEQTQHAQINPYMSCFYEEEQTLLAAIADAGVADMRSLIAAHVMRQNIEAKYHSNKAVEFLRQNI